MMVLTPPAERDEMQASRLFGPLGKMQTTTTPSLCHQQIGDQSRFNCVLTSLSIRFRDFRFRNLRSRFMVLSWRSGLLFTRQVCESVNS
jgi:hypothetical protein